MLRRFLLCLGVMSLAGCSWIHARHIPVQQGNEITQAKVNKLSPGMTPAAVQAIMGPPVLTSTFTNDNLHYVYTMKDQGGTTIKRVTLTFDHGKLSQVAGTYAPQVAPL